jgi:hypothetical protein
MSQPTTVALRESGVSDAIGSPLLPTSARGRRWVYAAATMTVAELEPEGLLDEAAQRTDGLRDLGEGPFLEPMRRFVASLEREAALNAIGVAIARERILGHTVSRLRYVDDRKQYPEIARQEITRPVFIIGLPRTGTTILHDILAQDPANRVPMTWETMFPSPPPETASFESDPRIETCEATFPPIDAMIPGFKAMHPMGARLSQECVTMMGEAMCTPLFHNQFRVPSYQDWVDDEADFSHVYTFHRKQLQHLQSRHARDRWVLKTGAHMWGLEHLLATYPDARIVFTHRDPLDSMTSYASLTSLVRSMGAERWRATGRHGFAKPWITPSRCARPVKPRKRSSTTCSSRTSLRTSSRSSKRSMQPSISP